MVKIVKFQSFSCAVNDFGTHFDCKTYKNLVGISVFLVYSSIIVKHSETLARAAIYLILFLVTSKFLTFQKRQTFV